MQYFRLQIGCLAVLIYVAVVYVRGCSKYHVKMTASRFWIILLLGMFTTIADAGMSWSVGMGDAISPIFSYVFHTAAFIGLDSTIFFLCVYLLDMMGRYPKRNAFLLYIPLIVNIVLVIATSGIFEYLGGNTGTYQFGPAIVICFTMIGLYLALTVTLNRRYFHQITKEKRDGIITFLVAYAVISVIQMTFSDDLASMGIGVCILVLGIYLNSEDPAIKELGRYYSETVMSFANLIEERDGSTGGHVKRTSQYVDLIANKLKG